MDSEPLPAGDPAYTPPPEVRAVVETAALMARTASPVGVSLAGVEVADALLGHRRIERRHVRAMAAHHYEPGTLSAAMFGGEPGRRWAHEILVGEANEQIRALLARASAGVRANNAQATNLRVLSAALQRADSRFRSKVQGVLAQAMRRAERHALTKVNVRARKLTKAQRAAVAGELDAHRITPAVLAAIATTDDELLGQMFEDAGDEIADLFAERQDARRKALLAAFLAAGLTLADLDREWRIAESQRTDELRQFVGLAMFNEARSRLQSGATGPQLYQQGELPFDTAVPGAIVNAVVAIADGETLTPTSGLGPEITDTGQVDSPFAAGGNPIDTVGDELVDGIVQSFVEGGAVKSYTWFTGDPARPFDPHQELSGITFTRDEFYVVCGKDPSEFPYGNEAYFPGDHAGCQCELVVDWISAEDATGPEDGTELGDGIAASAQPRPAVVAAPVVAAIAAARADIARATELLPRARVAEAGDWDEEAHPRDSSGRFGSGDSDPTGTTGGRDQTTDEKPDGERTGSPEAHAQIDAMVAALGPPAAYDPSYSPRPAEDNFVQAQKDTATDALEAAGEYRPGLVAYRDELTTSLDRMRSDSTFTDEDRAGMEEQIRVVEGQLAQIDASLSDLTKACEILERQGLPSPRSPETVAALRSVADQMGPGATISLGSHPLMVNPEAVHGLADGMARMGGPEVMGALHVDSVTLTERGEPGSMAYIATDPWRSPFVMTNDAQQYGYPDKDKPGTASVNAAADARQFAELMAIHELGHALHGEAIRQAGGRTFSLRDDGYRIIEEATGKNPVATTALSSSKYGSTNPAEWIAEQFVMQVTGIRPGAAEGVIGLQESIDSRHAEQSAVGAQIIGDLWRTVFPDRPLPDPTGGPYDGARF